MAYVSLVLGNACLATVQRGGHQKAGETAEETCTPRRILPPVRDQKIMPVAIRALRGCGLVLKKPHTKTAVLVSFVEFFNKRCSSGFGSAVVVLPQKPRLHTKQGWLPKLQEQLHTFHEQLQTLQG
jgi:hypothetical protein